MYTVYLFVAIHSWFASVFNNDISKSCIFYLYINRFFGGFRLFSLALFFDFIVFIMLFDVLALSKIQLQYSIKIDKFVPPALFAASIRAVWKRVVGQGLGTKLSESPITENTMVGVTWSSVLLWFFWFSVLLCFVWFSAWLFVLWSNFVASIMVFHTLATSIVLLKKSNNKQTLWLLKFHTITCFR